MERRARLPVVGAGIESIQTERRAARERLAADRSIAGAVGAVEEAASWAEALAARALAESPPERPVACAAGCAFCCHGKVVATAPEVLRVAAHLEASLEVEALAAMRARIAAAAARTRGMTRAERAALRAPCPLLEEGRCSVYAVRPLACAGWISLDAAACERAFETSLATAEVPIHPAPHAIATATVAGLTLGLGDAGTDGAWLELVDGLSIALGEPGAGAAWLAGDPVFAPAPDAESAPALAALEALRDES